MSQLLSVAMLAIAIFLLFSHFRAIKKTKE